MTTEEIQKLAASIRDGKATKEEKLAFFKFLNLEMEELSKILKEVKK